MVIDVNESTSVNVDFRVPQYSGPLLFLHCINYIITKWINSGSWLMIIGLCPANNISQELVIWEDVTYPISGMI